ncbi:hypothetical protein XM38_004220 [Halomicronema hongdechloris C2206]|uniref:SppA protein n=1 Tax=Halomicronema hongdechloris C2206 TaxID=1641165 RepID=A0A1Z3HGV3_9CYAN|nr:hypothetical protein [Halomicronema hongdechloris]ASC69495.1 hypothetical protein XM38_004220 [Halomicronema hongdechloris C2206]
MKMSIPKEIQDCIQTISNQLDADLLLYSADIDEENADILIEAIRKKAPKRENVVLILATYGGDPDAAYRITRCLKRAYSKFTLFIFGYCKSAGTLIAIGADEIVMSDLAELGPLDVQVLKENDFRRSSGLDLQQALTILGHETFNAFEVGFLSTIYKSGGVITSKMAADIASNMAIGLLAPIAGQIDPLRLGELSRSMQVAYEYGTRLNPNIKKSINKLVAGYPSHSFVIDREEAQELFRNVRKPTDAESILESVLYECARSPAPQDMIFSLDVSLTEEDQEYQEHKQAENLEEANEHGGQHEFNGKREHIDDATSTNESVGEDKAETT